MRVGTVTIAISITVYHNSMKGIAAYGNTVSKSHKTLPSSYYYQQTFNASLKIMVLLLLKVQNSQFNKLIPNVGFF